LAIGVRSVEACKSVEARRCEVAVEGDATDKDHEFVLAFSGAAVVAGDPAVIAVFVIHVDKAVPAMGKDAGARAVVCVDRVAVITFFSRVEL